MERTLHIFTFSRFSFTIPKFCETFFPPILDYFECATLPPPSTSLQPRVSPHSVNPPGVHQPLLEA